MANGNGSTPVPDWLIKYGLGLAQAFLVPAVLGTLAWAWSAESRVAYLENENSAQAAQLAEAKSKLETVQQNNTEIALLKLELGYIKSGITDIKALLANRSNP